VALKATNLNLEINKIKHIIPLILKFIIVSYITISIFNFTKNIPNETKEFLLNREFQYSNDSNYELLTNLALSSEYNIFFIETNYNRSEFSTKQLCAIESAARTNPKSKVFVFSVKAQFSKDNLDLIENYLNLFLVKFDPLELFRDTPLLVWWKKGEVLKSPHITVHLSDAARYALLYKYGGFYSDLDTIAMKSFETLRNKSGAGYLNETWNSLGNGFLHFSRRHPFLEFLMKRFELKYVSGKWGKNGPALLIESLATYCEFSNIYKSLMNQTSLSIKHKCNDLVIFPGKFFYPFTYRYFGIKKLFARNASKNISEIIESYSTHFYGGLSSKIQVSINDFSVYEYLAAQNCLKTYDFVKDKKIKFF